MDRGDYVIKVWVCGDCNNSGGHGARPGPRPAPARGGRLDKERGRAGLRGANTDGPGRAAIIAPEGSGLRVLAPGNLDASMACSAWSPDGSKLLCSVDSGNHALNGIYAIGADGTGLTR